MKSRLWLVVFYFLLSPIFNNVHASDHLGLAVTDLIGSAPLEKEFGAFRDRLSRLARVDIRLCPVRSRMEAVRALNSGRVDLVLTGPAEYVVFRKKTESQPLVVFSRPDYFAGIVVMAESGISTIADLKGKKVAFGAVGVDLEPLGSHADSGRPWVGPSSRYQIRACGRRGSVVGGSDSWGHCSSGDELPSLPEKTIQRRDPGARSFQGDRPGTGPAQRRDARGLSR